MVSYDSRLLFCSPQARIKPSGMFKGQINVPLDLVPVFSFTFSLYFSCIISRAGRSLQVHIRPDTSTLD